MRKKEKNVVVYIFNIGSCLTKNSIESNLSKLPEMEQNRIIKYHNWEDRQRSLFSHLFIRTKLKETLNCNHVTIKRTSRGRPYICPDTHTFSGDFNLSHSNERIICGISPDSKIGVDIEHLRYIDSSIVQYCFSQEELNFYNNLPAQERIIFFYKIWTLKEAYVKALGIGLSYSFPSFGFNMELWMKGKVELNESEECALKYNFRIIEHANYIGAICTEKPNTLTNIKIIFIDDNSLRKLLDLN